MVPTAVFPQSPSNSPSASDHLRKEFRPRPLKRSCDHQGMRDDESKMGILRSSRTRCASAKRPPSGRSVSCPGSTDVLGLRVPEVQPDRLPVLSKPWALGLVFLHERVFALVLRDTKPWCL